MESYVVLTGVSSGIGRATAVRLAKEKKNLILIARRKDKLEALAEDLKSKKVKIILRQIDLTDKKVVERFFADLSSISVEAVINNAGAAFGRDPIETAKEDDLEGMVELNIKAFLRVVHHSLPLLRKTEGHLVNIGSVAGLEVYENGATYCATKHFVHALTKGIRMDMLGSGIRVTEILPGNVDTEFSLVRFKGDVDRAKKVYEGYEPLHAEDVADAIWYALSRPKHVNVQHMLIMPTAQSSVGRVARKDS